MTMGGWSHAAETGAPAPKPLVAVFEDPAEELRPDTGSFAIPAPYQPRGG
jgi:hypothetical protein